MSRQAEVTRIADAVVEQLNELDTAPPFRATRGYAPLATLEELAGFRVTVVPRGLAPAAGTLARRKYEYELDVAIERRAADDGRHDEGLLLVEQITDYLLRFPTFEACPDAQLTGVAVPLLYDPKALQEKSLLRTVVRLTVVVLREPGP